MKRFIYASLAYLAVGSILSMFNALPSMAYFAKYAHTHFNLAGFMAMMVFGIGYFILPRFNGSDLRFPNWIAIHFWLGNISLIGMVLSKGLAIQFDNRPLNTTFEIFATFQLISILMFVINIWATLSRIPAPALAPQPVRNPAPQPVRREAPLPVVPSKPLPQAAPVAALIVSQHSRVSDLVDLAPSVKTILVSKGVSSLALPGHIDKVRTMGVTLGMACRNHGLDLEGMIEAIENELRVAGIPVASSNAGEIRSDAMIGEVLQNYPEARAVFQRHFGSGCFDCPGQAFESVSMACKMHGIDEQEFLNELAAAVR
jgi:hybrid cluster-associated redox disulfide protein